MEAEFSRRGVLAGAASVAAVIACGGNPREGTTDVDTDLVPDVSSARQRFEKFFDDVRELREQIRAFEDLQEVDEEALAQVCAIAEQIRGLVLGYIADVNWELHPDQDQKPQIVGTANVIIGESQLVIPDGSIPDSDVPFGAVAVIVDALHEDLQKEFRISMFLGGDMPFGNVVGIKSVVDSGDAKGKPVHAELEFDVKLQGDTDLQLKYAYESDKGPKVWMRAGNNGAQTLVNGAECKGFKGKDLHDATTFVQEVVENLVEEFPEK